MRLAEYLLGLFVALLMVPLLLVALVIALFELPRYLRIRSL